MRAYELMLTTAIILTVVAIILTITDVDKYVAVIYTLLYAAITLTIVTVILASRSLWK